MQSIELTKPITTESLLAEFESRFNQTMDLSKFTKEELEDVANKIRTKIHEITQNKHFGEELKNDKSKTKEQRAQYSKDLGALKGRKEELIADTLAVQEDLKTERDETRREALLERISQNTLELSTKQDRRVALAQLPSSLQDIALKSRKTIGKQ